MYWSRVWITALVALLLHSETNVSITNATIYRFVHDFIQYNLAGLPSAHKKTQWDFDPEVGKQRRSRYEQENGRFGEHAITKLGMGIGYKNSWAVSVAN
ncbi:hypothetical protein P5V15_004213 [Pogonomyrmex californicus]